MTKKDASPVVEFSVAKSTAKKNPSGFTCRATCSAWPGWHVTCADLAAAIDEAQAEASTRGIDPGALDLRIAVKGGAWPQ